MFAISVYCIGLLSKILVNDRKHTAMFRLDVWASVRLSTHNGRQVKPSSIWEYYEAMSQNVLSSMTVFRPWLVVLPLYWCAVCFGQIKNVLDPSSHQPFPHPQHPHLPVTHPTIISLCKVISLRPHSVYTVWRPPLFVTKATGCGWLMCSAAGHLMSDVVYNKQFNTLQSIRVTYVYSLSKTH